MNDMGKIAFINENAVTYSLVMTDVENWGWDHSKYVSLHDTLEEAKVALLVLLSTRC